jgi:hypothetical protein
MDGHRAVGCAVCIERTNVTHTQLYFYPLPADEHTEPDNDSLHLFLRLLPFALVPSTLWYKVRPLPLMLKPLPPMLKPLPLMLKPLPPMLKPLPLMLKRPGIEFRFGGLGSGLWFVGKCNKMLRSSLSVHSA